MGNQCLVRRHHMLTGRDRGATHAIGDTIGTADQFGHDVDIGGGGHRDGVVMPAKIALIETAIAGAVARRDIGDHQRPTGALLDQGGLFAQ